MCGLTLQQAYAMAKGTLVRTFGRTGAPKAADDTKSIDDNGARESRRLKTMEGLLAHPSFWKDLIGRAGGPITFRLILQPVIAVILAIRDGLKDAKACRPLYFWSLFTHSTERWQTLKEGWKSVGVVFVFAIVIDGVYQFIVFRWFYPGEALAVAIVLAIVPYLQVRDLANGIARHNIKSKSMERNHAI